MSFDLPLLPNGWQYISLEELSQETSITYGVVQPGTAVSEGVPIIRVNNFKNGRLELSDVMHIAPDIESKYARTRLAGGEVLLTIVGSVGQVAVVPKSLNGFNVARAVAVIHPLDVVSANWIAICLRSPLAQHLLGSRANTTVQTTINLKDLRALPVPVPPVAIRQAIEDLIYSLDDRIALLRETNASLEAMAQALFKSWFVDFDPVHANAGTRAASLPAELQALFPSTFTDTPQGLVPEGWRVVPFTETINVIGGGTPKTSIAEYWGGDIPWFSVVDAPAATDVFVIDTEKRITESGLNHSSTKLLPAGTTIISARGTVGRLALVGREMAMNQSCYGLRGKYGDDYFTYFTTCRLVEALKQRSHGSVFDTITRDTLAGVSVISPDSAVVAAFESVVGAVMGKIKNNLQQAQTLATLRDTLLPRLISGQLRLPEVEAALVEAGA
ncbi:restriction endonuclease subunit S [Laribacter hongkongensis]|uniref:restriction endonuclease subunit S n=1 Tax=Laribacter hongkongensis TaxID=168471 RepID=UPI001EFEE194|nr:restriction endonuclease subunit S [Laribacter hongkongensis]MCG9084280.1 restriction endonuclease subunit S [Laribacter hongkongensis]